jgi:hypothetical protein
VPRREGRRPEKPKKGNAIAIGTIGVLPVGLQYIVLTTASECWEQRCSKLKADYFRYIF